MKQSVAVIVGSTHKGSINKKLALALTKLGAAQFDFTFIDIDKLPMYNQDLEEEKPQEVLDFAATMKKFDTVLIVTPEHNRSIPTLLKNAIDWGSRPISGNIWQDRRIAIAGTTPGAIGTALAQAHLRQILGASLKANIMGGELYLTMKPDLIDDTGNVSNADTQKFLQGFMDRFAEFAGSAKKMAA